jgi:hypothetical protein
MAHLRSEKLYKTTILPGTLVYDESDNSNYIRSEVIYEHNDHNTTSNGKDNQGWTQARTR